MVRDDFIDPDKWAMFKKNGEWISQDEIDEPEPKCECTSTMGRWDQDETVDASDCLLHGPRSEMARRQHQQEVDDNFAWAESMRPYFEGTN